MKKIILGILTLFLATSPIPTLHAMESELQSNDTTTYLLNRCIQFCRDHKGIVAIGSLTGSLTLYVWTKYITAPWQEVTIPRQIIPVQNIPAKDVYRKEFYLFGGKMIITLDA